MFHQVENSSLRVLHLLPASSTLMRTLLSAFYSPCRYSDVIVSVKLRGQKDANSAQGFLLPPSTPQHWLLSSTSYFLSTPLAPLYCLCGIKALFHVGEWWEKPRRVSLALTHSFSRSTLNPVLRGVVMYCICRFIKHALHRPEAQAVLHLHMLTSISK